MDPQPQTPQTPDPVPPAPTVGDGVDANAASSEPAVAAAPTSNVKQQVVEKVQSAKNVLVTVGSQPSVDELSSALGLTFLLGKLGKHVTAVFSGKTPPAIDFLDPDKTFERTVDSLRDFIIALDKEKADKLRYKVEEDVVKVYITPYKTTISEKDLEFSQGDFNVDAVVALGVVRRDELDSAITSHGRILHDAEVITINADGNTSDLGSIDWSDNSASSIAEMLVSISESFGSGLLDEQIATALLTGIVAETNRFSNEKTSPKVMTMSAQLMAAGANQQLIATNLRQQGTISESVRDTKPDDQAANGNEMVLTHDKPIEKKSKKPKKKKPKQNPQTQKQDTASGQQGAPISPAPKSASNFPEQNESKSQPNQSQIPAPVSPAPDKPVAPTASPPMPAAPKSSTSPMPEPAGPGAPVSAAPPAEPKIESHHTMIPPTDAGGPKPIGGQADKPDMSGSLNSTAEAEEAKKTDELTDNRSESSESADAEKAIEEARKALEAVESEQEFDPANKPTEAVGAAELPPLRSDAPQPDSTTPHEHATEAAAQNSVQAAAEEPSPVDAFMQPHADAPSTPNMPNVQTPPPVVPAPPTPAPAGVPNMPPPPPMPSTNPLGGDTGAPPLPPLPGQPSQNAGANPSAGFQPQTTPAFMQNVPQSQNSWTQAGDDLAAKNADKDAARQKKLDDMAADYDKAVDQNLINQGKPPVNNPDDHSTFPLPPSK